MRPIRPSKNEYQRFPSGPQTIDVNGSFASTGKRVATPAVVRRPIAPEAVNHKAPSGPRAIEPGNDSPEGRANTWTAPDVVTRTSAFAYGAVSHSAPSDPATRPPSSG